MSTAGRTRAEVHYPESDGEPMGETGIHVGATMELFATLKWQLFKDRPEVYVAADMFFYYEEGNPKAVKAPDIMVIKGVGHAEERRTFKLWAEGVGPAVIFEVTSAETKRDDLVVKRALYARLGVAEYYLFDPLGEYLEPRFLGLRLAGGTYEEMKPDARDGGILSPELGVKLMPEGSRLLAYSLETGRQIPSPAEMGDLVESYESLLANFAAELKNREKLERKAAREKKKADAERLRAEAAIERADAAIERADAERSRADALEAELNRLRAVLGEVGKPPGP